MQLIALFNMQLIALFSMQLIALFSMQLIALFSLQLIALFSLQLKRVFSCHVIAPSTFIRLPIVVTTTNNAPQRQSPKIIVVPLHRKKVTSQLRYINHRGQH